MISRISSAHALHQRSNIPHWGVVTSVANCYASIFLVFLRRDRYDYIVTTLAHVVWDVLAIPLSPFSQFVNTMTGDFILQVITPFHVEITRLPPIVICCVVHDMIPCVTDHCIWWTPWN
jgi:hypothetical protein